MIEIAGYSTFEKILPLDKGYSGDKKFYIETSDDKRLLLRISDIKEYERRKTMFEMMKTAASLHVPMPQPLDFGTCDNGKSVYQLLTWCDGKNLEIVLPVLSEKEQYAIGIESGRILRTIHSIQAPDTLDDWFIRYTSQNDDRVSAFSQTNIQLEGGEALLHYYNENKELLRNRPQCFHHGDWHTENLLLSEGNELSVIDWELLDYGNYGDPWEEFNRINNCPIIPHYHSGQIKGYFGGEPPEEFWRLLAVYLSAGALMLMSWAYYLQPNELDYAIKNASKVLSCFNQMKNLVPSWYSN
jgi:Predicted aminoglycoside phosphotransferase